MCIGIPMQIVEIYEDGISGVVEAGNTKKHCFFMVIENPKVGDYVLVHAGTAIAKIDEQEAKENVKLIEQCLLGATGEPKSI